MKRRVKAKIVAIVWLSFLATSFVVFVQAIFNLDDSHNLKIAEIFYLIGRLSGLLGFLFLSFMIFSGDTARYFDRFFGLDKIIKFQRKFAPATAVLVLSHPVFFILSGKAILPYIIPNFSIIPLALGIISFYIFIIVMITSIIYKRISYNIWQYIHILTYILFFFSLYHAINWGSDYMSISIRIIYGIILIFLMAGVVYRTYYKIRRNFAGKFYAQGIKNETKDTFTLALKHEKPFLFKAGQFCFLRLNKDQLYARHPFTISSSPKEKELCLTVKLTGRFTKALSELKRGEEIIVDGPFGIFTIDNYEKDLVFIAGGVGITPFMSIIRDRIENNVAQNIILFYGSKTEKDIIYKEQLDNIKEDWFKKVYVLSDDNSSPNADGCEHGHINKETINKYVKNTGSSLFYICGPWLMKNSLKKSLNELGVDKQNIIIEDFFW